MSFIKFITSLNLQNFSFLQNLGRYFIVFGGQVYVIIVFTYLIFKILRRKISKSTISLSLSYLMIVISFLLNIVYVLVSEIVDIVILLSIYYFISYFLILAPAMLLIFVLNLLGKKRLEFQIAYLIVISISSFTLIIFLNGIDINPYSYRPQFTWYFVWSVYLFITLLITLPIIRYSLRLLRYLKDKTLYKKFKFSFIGIILLLLSLYGAILYNAWENTIYRFIWSFLSLLLLTLAASLTYFGLG